MFWKEVCIPPSKGKEQGFIQPRAALGASLRKQGSVPACRWDASLPCEGDRDSGVREVIQALAAVVLRRQERQREGGWKAAG